MSVKKNIVLNAIGQIGNRIVRILDQLLLVPFFLTIWGAEYYGEWLTISMVPSILAFSDLGFGTAVSNHFVLLYSGGHYKEAADTYVTGLIITSLTVLLGVFLSIIVILGGWKLGILENSVISPSDIMISLSFLMASRLLAFYMQLFEGFFRSKSKASIAFHMYTLEGVFRILVGLFCLLIGCDIVGYSIGQFVVAILFNLCFAFFALRIVKDLPKGNFNYEICIITVKKGFGFMLTPIWQSIYMQGSTFAVRIVLGPTAVAIFNTVRTVCKSINAAFSIVNGSIYPEIQVAYGKGNINMVKSIYIYAMQLVFILSIFGLFFLLLFGQDLYSWWTHNELSISKDIWYIFMLGIPLNALWWTAGTVFRAINQPTLFSIYGFIVSVVSAFLSYVLAYPFGMKGAAIGFVSMDLLMLCLTLPLANKKTHINISELIDFNYVYNKFFRKE